jgi:hypothetical protein
MVGVSDDLHNRHATVPFSSLFFTCEGDVLYTGCGNTEHRGQKARASTWKSSCPVPLEERDGVECFLLWWKLKRACRTHGLSTNAHQQATVNCTLLDVMAITNALYSLQYTYSNSKRRPLSVVFFRTFSFFRDRIFNLLRSPRIDSMVSIPPAYVTWRPSFYSIPTPIDR